MRETLRSLPRVHLAKAPTFPRGCWQINQMVFPWRRGRGADGAPMRPTNIFMGKTLYIAGRNGGVMVPMLRNPQTSYRSPSTDFWVSVRSRTHHGSEFLSGSILRLGSDDLISVFDGILFVIEIDGESDGVFRYIVWSFLIGISYFISILNFIMIGNC